jgi:hypothetical protein
MATYRMANIWRDPRTGMCYFRRRNPAELRRVLGWEQKVSLRTKDLKVARQRYAVVQLEADERIREARQRLLHDQHQGSLEDLRDAYDDSVTPAWRDYEYRVAHGLPVAPGDEPEAQFRQPFRSHRWGGC